MRSGYGVFIRRDKYSMHEVSSREKRGKTSIKVDLLVTDLHGNEDCLTKVVPRCTTVGVRMVRVQQCMMTSS
jgi:uncharacterized protein (DUF111 family)